MKTGGGRLNDRDSGDMRVLPPAPYPQRGVLCGRVLIDID